MFLRCPAGVLDLRAFLHSGTLCFDGACYALMLTLSRFECRLRLGDRLLATLPLLGPCSFLLSALALTLPLSFFILQDGPAGRLVVGLAGRLLFRLCTTFFAVYR